MIQLAETGEPLIDESSSLHTPKANSSHTDLICRRDEPATKSAALLVLMSTLENSSESKALPNQAKHFAFARCGELNLNGIVDTQAAMLQTELFAGNTP